jgi:hypothetical protein
MTQDENQEAIQKQIGSYTVAKHVEVGTAVVW